MCHVQNCNNEKQENTKACAAHQPTWQQHISRFGRATVLGIRRLLRRSVTGSLPWNPIQNFRGNAPAHDADGEPVLPPRKNHFTAGRYYCIETICKPCGVVLAWTKFFRSESPSQIIEFSEKVYPQENQRPSYIAIDKGCLLLKRLVACGKWLSWKKTTRIIVDSYHYINHRATDYLCRTWCNPAPPDGRAPNLVEDLVIDGKHFQRRAFNTQVCYISSVLFYTKFALRLASSLILGLLDFKLWPIE